MNKLETSIEGNTEDATDSFIDGAKTTSKATGNRTTTGRPKSVVEKEKQLRDSVGYALKNKYGEGARDDTDSEEEDPTDKHASVKKRMSKKVGQLTNVQAAFTIFKAFVGIGILYLPNYLYVAGWGVDPALMIGSLLLTLYCVKLLTECAEELAADSMPTIAAATHGKWAKVITDMLIVGSQLGFCTSYVYFIAS